MDTHDGYPERVFKETLVREGYSEFTMRLAVQLNERVLVEAKLQKTDRAKFIRTAIEKYLEELDEQRIAAKYAAWKPRKERSH